MGFKIRLLDGRITEDMLKPSTEGSAGIDLRACIEEDIFIHPNQTVMIKSGISVWLKSKGLAGIILPRSGLGSKGLVIGNLVGLIDSDYQGEITISVWNRSEQEILIRPMDRIAQLVIIPVAYPDYEIVQSFEDNTQRGENGYGSTGTN